MSSFLVALLVSTASAAELSPGDVARLALDHDPTLAASATEAHRADLLVLGEEHGYSTVLSADAGVQASQGLGTGATSNLASSGGVTLTQPLATGTELSLYVGADQASTTFGASSLDDETSTTAIARLGLTQPIGAGAGTTSGWAARDQARASLDVSEASWRETASGVVRDALSAYWELAYAEAAVRIDEQALATAVRQRDDAAARVDSGSLAPAELLSYETRVATLDEALTQSRADAESRAIGLQRRLGLPERPSAASVAIPAPDAPAEGLVERAVAMAPSVLSSRSSVDLARVQARIAGDNLEPSLAVQTWVQAEKLVDGVSKVGATDVITGYVGLTGSLALDRTKHRTEVERGLLAVTSAELRLAAAEQAVTIEAEQTLATDAAARRRLELAERTLDVAQRQVEAERARVEIGAGIPIEVREAEDSARDAELRVLRAKIDVVLSDVALDHLTGALVAMK